MGQITDAKEAVSIARIYLKEMLGHPYFETETIEIKQDAGSWIVYLELVHLMRTERTKYKIKINSFTGIVENVTRVKPNENQ